MIEAENLVKWYGPTHAVNGINFTIPKGQIVGFLGPNGAGKSTTLRILTGYIPPTSGAARIDGFDVLTQSQQARQNTGYLPESTPLYLEMRVEEYLHYRGKLLAMNRQTRNARINIVCDRCGLSKIRRRIIGQLSKGNRQRVGIAQALLHNPAVLILDEPTAGLDPNQIGEIRNLIRELKGQHTIILSSHILPEIEKTADRVIIIARGEIMADGTPNELRKQVSSGARILVEVKASPQAVQKALSQIQGVTSIETNAQGQWTQAIVTPTKEADPREQIGLTTLANQWAVREIRNEVASLEQFFIQITATQNQAKITDAA